MPIASWTSWAPRWDQSIQATAPVAWTRDSWIHLNLDLRTNAPTNPRYCLDPVPSGPGEDVGAARSTAWSVASQASRRQRCVFFGLPQGGVSSSWSTKEA